MAIGLGGPDRFVFSHPLMTIVVYSFVTSLNQPLLQNTFPPLNVLIPSCHFHQNVFLFDVVCIRMIMAPLIS